jgi:GntR family transcriptional repressor for pyruvate dehydrogenase complex
MVKKAQDLLFDIVRDIGAAGLKPGDRLPSQAEMPARYGAGLVPLREALRMLELAGMISMRSGRAGGVVADPAGAEQLAVITAVALSMSRTTYGELVDACAVAEPLLAAAAANNPDREAVRTALAPSLSVANDERFDFRDAVARAAGNPALRLVTRLLSHVAADPRAGARPSPPNAAEDGRQVIDAILAGDPEQAYRRMAAHLRETLALDLARLGRSREDDVASAQWPLTRDRRPATARPLTQDPAVRHVT